MADLPQTRERGSFLDRLVDVAFQGHPPVPYIKTAWKFLIGGAVGIVIAWVLQPFFTTVLGLPYWMAYWPAVMGGYIGNLRSQVKIKNLVIEDGSKKAG